MRRICLNLSGLRRIEFVNLNLTDLRRVAFVKRVRPSRDALFLIFYGAGRRFGEGAGVAPTTSSKSISVLFPMTMVISR